MAEPQRKGLFVAGTDTGVGKTVVAAGLVQLARERGLIARAVKPVETGCPIVSGTLHPQDGAFLHSACGGEISLDECAPFRFSLPASPYRAAVMEDRLIKVADMAEHVLAVAEGADLTVVEGAGGLLVPVEERLMMIDLIQRLGYPTLLVARSALGTINHTLLSLEALEARDMAVAGIVLSRSRPDCGPEEEFTPRDLARLVGDRPLVSLPLLAQEVLTDPGRIAAEMKSQWDGEILKRWLGPEFP